MFLEVINENEVISVIRNFKNKTYTGYNNTDMVIVKKVISVYSFGSIYPYLSFNRGVFPNKMKIAKVIPIYKTGIYTLSLLPQFSKILKRLFHSRLDKCIDTYNILGKSQ